MNLTLKVWRQKGPDEKGKLKTYEAKNISPDISFLEMLDAVNEELVSNNEEPIAFDSDCREGICGTCNMIINGRVHGPKKGMTLCQLHMRHFKNGQTIFIEPARAKAFPLIKDLIIDRSSLDKIIKAGGYISMRTGSAPDANDTQIPTDIAEKAMDAAACIGCGGCVAACSNSSAMLFTSAKISQLALLPQGKVERYRRAVNMVREMDKLGFGNCTNEAECEAECPKEIKLVNIARMNREYLKGIILEEE